VRHGFQSSATAVWPSREALAQNANFGEWNIVWTLIINNITRYVFINFKYDDSVIPLREMKTGR